ncbi:unnamed protein product [Closterium sp. NIES-64]|nr:unnamed protein product [Closterium sp. NIES-64]
MAGLLSPHMHRHVSLSPLHQTPRDFSVEPLLFNGYLTCPRASKASKPIAIACISTLPRRRSNASKQRFSVTATARSRHVSSVSHGFAGADGWRCDSSIDPRKQTGRVRASRGDSSNSRDGWQGRDDPYRESRFGSRQARTDGRFGGSGGGGWREDERDPRQERDYNEGFDASGRERRGEWDRGERKMGGGRERGRGDWREGEGDGERNWRREGSGRWDADEAGERGGGGRESGARDGYGRFEQDRRGGDQRGSFSRDGGSRYSDRGRGRDEVPRGARRDYNEGSTSGFRNRGGLRERRDDAGRGDGSRFREGFKQGSRNGEQWESEGRREYDSRGYSGGFKREDQAGEEWEDLESRMRRESFSGRRVGAAAAGGGSGTRGEERGGTRRARDRDAVREGVRGGVEGKEEEGAWQDPPLHVGEVASVSNAFVKRAVRLRQSSAARRAWGRVLVAGEVPVQEICAPWLQAQEGGEGEAAREGRREAEREGRGETQGEAQGETQGEAQGQGGLGPIGRGQCPLDILLVQSESPLPPPPGLVRVARRVLYVSPAVMSRLAGVQSVGAAAVAAVMLLPASFKVLESGGDGGGDGGGYGGEEEGDEVGEEERGGWDGKGYGEGEERGGVEGFVGRAVEGRVEEEGGLGEEKGSLGGGVGREGAEGEHSIGRRWFEREGGGRGWGAGMSRVLVLDGVQDPGNLGTLLRTALAFDWVSETLNPGRGEEERCKRRGTSGIVLGSEGQGLSATALRLCQPMAIPMPGGAESLNVAVAGGILLFLLGPHSPLPPSRLSTSPPSLPVSV